MKVRTIVGASPSSSPEASELADLKKVVRALVRDLRRLGFGKDDDISGADAVDVINEHFDDLCAAVAPKKKITHKEKP